MKIHFHEHKGYIFKISEKDDGSFSGKPMAGQHPTASRQRNIDNAILDLKEKLNVK